MRQESQRRSEDDGGLAARVAGVRAFNRFYTRRIGVLQEGLLRSPFSLAEARVLYELAQRARPTASELGQALGLDAGYLSRILAGFASRGLVGRRPSPSDGRRSLLRLTAKGRRAFASLDRRSQGETAALLAPLAADEQGRLVGALQTVERLLGGAPAADGPYVLRPLRPGDIGWIVHRHAVLYAREYGWDERFEALVAGIAARFIARHDPARERFWIAERDGEIVGSVLLVRQSRTVAKLRLLLVEPAARGHGIGARLVDECIRFARQAGYEKMTLWTHSVLIAARHIYQSAGFQLMQTWTHEEFGKELVGENWELTL